MRILVADDERNIRESIQRLLSLDGIDSASAANGREALAMLRDEPFDALVTDLKMPVMGGQELIERLRDEGMRCPVIMISALGEIQDAVKALKAGATDYLIKPFDPDELILKLKAAVANMKREDRMEAGARTAPAASGFIGQGSAARTLERTIDKIAGSDTTVLISGESGSGKEVVAREIHARSARSAEPFVAVNIGGIHETLMESELFGHEKGAFTGADSRKIGLFELAGGGSLFLDEIGEMPLALQVKLLRVLQERRIRRLGGTRDIPIAARILSATNKDIEAAVRGGRFREDLYYRLNVVRVPVPPLRERREDIPLLAGCLLERLRARMGKGPAILSRGALEALSEYSYPGNVRELENLLERALIYADGEEIQAVDLGFAAGASPTAASIAASSTRSDQSIRSAQSSRSPGLAPHSAAATPEAAPDAPSSLDGMERAAIERALAASGGNRTKAAEALGISRRTILNKIKRYGLQRP